MTNIVGNAFLFVYVACGFIGGMLYRKIAYFRRSGTYVKNDDRRIGGIVMFALFLALGLGQAKSLIVYHRWVADGAWPLCYFVLLSFGFFRGFGYEMRSKGVSVLNNSRVNLTYPITKPPDE